MLVPLIKHLKSQGKVTLIGTSSFGAQQVFDGFDDQLFDQKVVLDSTLDWVKHSASFRKTFDVVYLDYFAATRKNLMLAHVIAKSIITNHIPRKLPLIFHKKIKRVKPVVGIHEGAQYMRYIDETFKETQLKELDFQLTAKPHNSFQNLKNGYITIQPGSGNNAAPWKTWPLEKWQSVINELSVKTSHSLVILGDESELSFIESLPQNGNVVNLIGNTHLEDLPGILSNAVLHIGHDSGLMHIAGCLGTPTITVWGGSDPALFGWQKLNPEKHIVIQHKLSCHPCNRWLSPNTSKVDIPSICPDFACLEKVNPKQLIEATLKQLES